MVFRLIGFDFNLIEWVNMFKGGMLFKMGDG